ncbi:hypothetical protein THO17_17390 [Marinomonas sp. THO17]
MKKAAFTAVVLCTPAVSDKKIRNSKTPKIEPTLNVALVLWQRLFVTTGSIITAVKLNRIKINVITSE